MLQAKFQNHRSSGSEEYKIYKRFLLFIAMVTILVMIVTMTIYINFHSPFLTMLHIKFGFDWPSSFREDVWILWSYTCLNPKRWGRQPPEDIFSININLLSICILPASFPPFIITFYWFSPFKCMGNICWPCHKIGQGHPKVMIYINFVELLSLMLHAKFQNHRPSGSGEEIF